MNIKTSPASSLTVDELIVAQAHLQALVEKVHENGHDAPASLKAELREVDTTLEERLRADKERELARLKIRAEELKTTDQKRKETADKIAALEKELGFKSTKKGA